MEYYPDNTLAKYRVKLAKPLILDDGPYEAALVEIIYPHRRLSVEPDEASIVIHSVTKGKRKSVDKKVNYNEDMVEDYTPGSM
jgi:hypothetical protein